MHAPITSVFFLLTKRKGGRKRATDRRARVSLSELHGQAILLGCSNRAPQFALYQRPGDLPSVPLNISSSLEVQYEDPPCANTSIHERWRLRQGVCDQRVQEGRPQNSVGEALLGLTSTSKTQGRLKTSYRF